MSELDCNLIEMHVSYSPRPIIGTSCECATGSHHAWKHAHSSDMVYSKTDDARCPSPLRRLDLMLSAHAHNKQQGHATPRHVCAQRRLSPSLQKYTSTTRAHPWNGMALHPTTLSHMPLHPQQALAAPFNINIKHSQPLRQHQTFPHILISPSFAT